MILAWCNKSREIAGVVFTEERKMWLKVTSHYPLVVTIDTV